MALNSSPVRTDIGYLRRRVKPAPAVEAATATTELEPERRAPSAGLSLAPATASAPRAAPVAAAPRAASPHSLPFAAPTIDDVRELGVGQPVLRLNARESAVGSLIVSGVDVAVWEDSDRVTGSATAAGDTAGDRKSVV